MDQEMACCRVLQTFLVLTLFYNCQCCIYELPQCRESIFGLSMAEYEINSTNNRPPNQRVCFSTNTEEYNVNNVTVKITASASQNGTFCTDILLNETQACTQNLSKTVMYVNLKEIVNSFGEIQANFTRDGKNPVTFRIIYAPNGIYSLNQTQLTVNPISTVNLQWSIYSTQDITYQHIDKTGMVSSTTRPGTFTISDVTECIQPKSNNIMPRRPRSATVSVSSINIEDTGLFIMTDSQFTSSVNVTVKVDSNAPILDTGGTGAITMVTRAQVNETKTLPCDIVGSSRSPSWYFNNVPLTSNGIYNISSTGLIITAVNISHAGLYSCVASNMFGTTEKYIALIVGAAPQITVSPPPIIIIQNNTRVIIPCTASGLPPPNIQWFTNNIQIIDGSGGASIDPTTGALYFEKPILLSNIYCHVSNIFGSVNSSTTDINILTNTRNFSGVLLPSPLVGPFITLTAMGSVDLVCYNVTDNNLRFQWSKDHANIALATSRVYTVNASDSGSSRGIYCCSIYDTSSNIIDQRCVVVYIPSKATFQTGLTNATIRSGSPIFYYCSATTDNNIDQPHLSWYWNFNVLNEINPARYSYHQNKSSLTTLMIINVTTNDEGIYSCKGNNNINNVETTAELRVVDTCGNNSLSSPSAEGDITQTRSSWSIPLNNTNAYIAEGTAENHFVLNKTAGSTLSPFMRQTMNIKDTGNYTLLFSCRMRSTAPGSVKPIVNLTVPGVAMTTVSLTFSIDSWQWVSTEMNFILESSGELWVTMEINEDAGNGDAVYFDDMCASLRSERLINPSPTPTTSTTTPQTILGLRLVTIYIIAGSGLFAILVCLFIFCCCICCCYHKKRRRYDPNGQHKKKFTKDLATSVSNHYHKNNGTEFLSLTKNSDGQSPTTLTASEEHQPVYVMPGETPVYLDTAIPLPTNNETFLEDDDYTNPRTNSNSHLLRRSYPQHQGTTSEIEITQSYDYPNLRETSLSKVVSPRDQSNNNVFQPQRTSTYENSKPVVDIYEETNEMYDDPNEKPENMYDDPDKNSDIEEVYDDPDKKSSDVEEVYDIPDNKAPISQLKPAIVPKATNTGNMSRLRPLPTPSSNDSPPHSRPVAIPNIPSSSTFGGSSAHSSFASVPLPPLPVENPTVIEEMYEDPRPQTPEPCDSYMQLNPGSLERHIYSSTQSLHDDEESEVEGEYLSITNQYLKVLGDNNERLKRLSLQEEGEYVT